MSSQPMWKPTRGASKAARRAHRHERKAKETQAMRLVRAEDRFCRFPLCGCRKAGLAYHVAHHPDEHRGMGGDKTADSASTQPHLLILLCSARHRENRVSLDKRTLRWRPLTKLGSRGMVAWDVDLHALETSLSPARTQEWREVARELSLHQCDFTEEGLWILKRLAGMEL